MKQDQPTPDPVRVSTPPIPIHRRPLTAREIVLAIAVSLAVALMIAARFPAAFAIISQAASVIGSLTGAGDVTITPALVASTGTAFIFGCFWPGSPLGRVLDWFASFVGGPQVSFTLADAQAAKDAVMPPAPRPERIPPSRDGGFARVQLLAWIVLAGISFLAGCSLLSGCGASPLQVHAAAASLTGDAINGGCTLIEHQRDVEQRAAVDATPTREAASVAVSAVRLRWTPFLDGCRLAIDAQLAWVAGLALFGISGLFDLSRSLAFAAPIVRVWDDVVALHPPLPDGLTLPALPAELLTLIASIAPTAGAAQ